LTTIQETSLDDATKSAGQEIKLKGINVIASEGGGGGTMADESLLDALADLREDAALTIVKAQLAAGENPLAILERCRRGVEVVGNRFECGAYFLPDLIMASEILRAIGALVKPQIGRVNGIQRVGTVVIGTVQGDIHDIGKDIVTFLLDANGFEVHDLGVDVPAQTFVAKIREVTPDIVGLSGFLTLAYDAMKSTVDAITDSGLRRHVKIIIGGGHIDDLVRQYTGADAYATSATDGVAICRTWVGASR
jgi:methanogenic corrinoid protein MtbC1